MITTGLIIKGHITITKIYENGCREVVFDDHNLIVDSGLSALSQLIGQTVATPTDLKFDRIRIGTDSTPPAATQTDIIAPLLNDSEQLISTVTENVSSTPGLTEFIATLGTAQGNGETLREVGLFTSNGTMIARQVYGDIVKSSTFAVEYTWRISFSR